jgi:HlyD family secretion protein
MDRALSDTIKQKRKRKQISKITLWILAFIVLIFLIRFLITPSIHCEDFYTVKVERGNIEASVSASGTVLPEFEEIITSPVQSRIKAIYNNTGDKIVPGDSILSLDKKLLRSNLERLLDELQMKRNNVEQLKIQLEKNLIDLKTNYEIKKLQVENMETELQEEKYLDQIGGGTKEKIEKAELNLKISELELEQLRQSIINLEKSMQADIRELNYEIKIQERSVHELKDKIEHSTVISDKEGVITWINEQIGKNINAGDELVKIANLKSYEVQGNISDLHVNRLQIGGKATIRINDKTDIRGEIVNISPTVKGSTIQFKIKLNEKNHPLLRPNLKVDVFVITSFKENVIRVKNGSFYKGASKQPVFVVDGTRLIKHEVEFGESNFDYVEIKNGLKEGEEVVISDMVDYERHDEIRIKP